ncbi:MAG: hypothetical protein OEX22_09935 [Cyclobacteriaceae bacterium]|nr:hypothetical protein [Cyclobacteriaceae bacterium]
MNWELFDSNDFSANATVNCSDLEAIYVQFAGLEHQLVTKKFDKPLSC